MFLTQKPHQTPSSEHQLAESDNELWLLNRGNRKDETPQEVRQITADINDEGEGGDEDFKDFKYNLPIKSKKTNDIRLSYNNRGGPVMVRLDCCIEIR